MCCLTFYFEHLNTNNIFLLNAEIKSESDLLPPGAEPGTMPTDVEQATGLERLELLGKMQGIDVFDMRPLDSSRLGTCDSFQPQNILEIRRSESVAVFG